MTTIGVLTAGGDCPGLNAAIRAVVTRAVAAEAVVVGVENGWAGLMEGRTRSLGRDDVRGISHRGGTILGTSREDPYIHGRGLESIAPALEETGIEVLVVIGGDGSLRTAVELGGEGLAVIGVPKTIDNDIGGTDVSFGFDTAVHIVTEAIDRLTTTAEAHNRIMVVEVMGRDSGWIAIHSGIAGGAEAILVPEVPYDLAALGNRLTRRHLKGKSYSLVVVAEGVTDPDGNPVTGDADALGFKRLGGISTIIANELERLTGIDTRVMVLGHLQRGGIPTAYDRVLATRLGLRAAEAALSGERGVMVALRGTEIVTVDLASACVEPRLIPLSLYEEAAWFMV